VLRDIVGDLQLMEFCGVKEYEHWPSRVRYGVSTTSLVLPPQQEKHFAAFLLDLSELFVQVYRDWQSSDFSKVRSPMLCR